MLVALTSQEEARKACEEGVIWRAQVLDCAPEGDLVVVGWALVLPFPAALPMGFCPTAGAQRC